MDIEWKSGTQPERQRRQLAQPSNEPIGTSCQQQQESRAQAGRIWPEPVVVTIKPRSAGGEAD